MRIKFSFSIALLALTLAGTAALADPPPKKKPTYPPPEQSNTIGTFGQTHHDPTAPAQPREPSAPQAAPETPKVDAEPPMPSAAPNSYVIHPDGGGSDPSAVSGSGGSPAAGTAMAPMMRAPMGPPPTGFLPDHPFVSGIVAGLIGEGLGSKLYGGQMMGDQNGVMVGYAGRVGIILLVAWMLFRLISRRASGAGEPGLAPPGRREPSFDRGKSDTGGPRREPTLGRRD